MTIHEQSAIKKRKSKMEILETIYNYIENENPIVFNKSSMLGSPWNLDPRTVEEFLQLAYYCQNTFPRIMIYKKKGKKLFQRLDYQQLKRELQNITLEPVPQTEKQFDLLNPKVFPVFKCKECEKELGYLSHHNEPMVHKKDSGTLICAFRECNFKQSIPTCHNKEMDIYVKYTKRNMIKEKNLIQKGEKI